MNKFEDLPKISLPTKLYVHAVKGSVLDNYKYTYDVQCYNLTEMSHCAATHILIAELEVNLAVPDIAKFDFTTMEISKLEQEKIRLRAELQANVDNIDTQIQNLLAITHVE